MSIKVCIAGATGWVGSELSRAVISQPDLELAAAVSPSSAGKKLGEVLGISGCDIVIAGSVEKALETEFDVLVDYTTHEAVKENTLVALAAGIRIVIGTSGLSDEEYTEIEESAIRHSSSVLAAGNFAITAVLLQKFAETAAQYVPSWEIIDYAGAGKRDAPSGTARQLAQRLGNIRKPECAVPISEISGVKETRGGELNGVQVHSLRLPSFVLSAEVIFGGNDERLTIRHDAGTSPAPYIDGTLLAIRKVNEFVGLKRGLDSVLDI